jgi:Zn-dependent protease
VSIGPEQIILIAIFLLVGFPVHEFSHAAAAYLLGDSTAKLFGRLTLNPIVHFDPMGGMMTIISALFGGIIFGWAKPTPVNPANLRDRRNGEVIVALAGPVSNFVMALLGAFVFRVVWAQDVALPALVYDGMFLFVAFNIALALFNLIPVPPLDGSAVLFRFLSPRRAWELRPMLAQYGIFILLAFVLLGGQVLGGIIFGAAHVLVGA